MAEQSIDTTGATGTPAQSKVATGISILTLVEKIVLPVALAMITWFAKQASDEIARSQVQVAAANVKVAEKELDLANRRAAAEEQRAVHERQLKYLELFYRDLRAKEGGSQQDSIALLYSLEPSVARSVANALVSSPVTPPTTRDAVRRLFSDIDRLGPLINFRLVIYHEKDERVSAEILRARLKNLGFNGDIALEQQPPSFIGGSVKFGYNYRFDPIYEKTASEYLGRLLREAMPEKPFTPVVVTGKRTDNVMTIFLYKKAG